MREIVGVKARENYVLEIELSNSHKIICNMKPRLGGVRFGGLKDITTFKNVHIKNSYTIEWANIYEITIDEILSMIEM